MVSEIIMKTLSIFVNDFLNIFPTLTNFQKKIFRYLQWFSKLRRCVYPAVLTIAKAVGCSIATVMRSTKLFNDLGWISKKQRGYCSNTYFINSELISLDLNDQSLFLRVPCEVNDSVLGSSSSVFNCNTSTTEKEVPKNNIKIPLCIKIRCLNADEQTILANKFSEVSLYHAIEDTKWYRRMGNKINNYFHFIWSRAKNYKVK